MEQGEAAPHRMVMAALGGHDQLSGAYRTLRSHNFAAEQICAIGTSDTMRALSQSSPSTEFGELVGSLEPLNLGAPFPILSTSGRFMSRLKSLSHPGGTPPSLPGASACWLEPAARQDMVERLQQGNVWLIVNAASHPQWVQGNRLLLGASQHPIKGLIR